MERRSGAPVRSSHAVGEVHDPHDLFQARRAGTHLAHAVVREGLEAFRPRRSEDLAGGGAPGDQLVDARIDLEELEDRAAPPIALVVALLAAYGAIERQRLARADADQAPLAGIRLVR